MAPSIKDLAKHAGVSVSTVTRALANRPDVNQKTRKRILELAEQLQYQPNILARSLVTSRTYTVGVIVPDLTNPFFPALIKGIEATLWERGYSVILADTDFDPEKERKTVIQFLSRQVDALIISPIETRNYHAWMDQVRSAGLPLVSLTQLDHHDADTVIASDRFGARSVAGHLLNNGRKRIVYIGNPGSRWADTERETGIRQACIDAGRAASDIIVRRAASGTMEAARAVVQSLVASGEEFDAVIAFDDMMALGVRTALAELGLRVPQDVALCGFDNIELSSLPDIDLTTVDIPKVELGRVSARLALERIEETRSQGDGTPRELSPYKEVVLNTKLIVRGSSR